MCFSSSIHSYDILRVRRHLICIIQFIYYFESEIFNNLINIKRPDFVEETNILDLHPIPDFLERECKSNPELNPYIKKPIFRRDPIDQDFSRKGYKDRQLVCPEKVWKVDSDLQILVHGGTDQRFAPEKCDHGLPLEKIVTVILEKGNLKKFVELSSFHQLPYGTSSSSITTPYVLIPGDLFDYQASEVNLYRMILEGEVQHADIISGSYVAKDGKWRQRYINFAAELIHDNNKPHFYVQS